MFPYLAPVAQQVFGNQAAAAQVERDFSACGNLLVPNRSRIDTYWVEMVMFLKANFEHIPAFRQIPMIAAKNIRACLPARFHGHDSDLMAAEAAFDVLTNTANPTADDIGLEGWIKRGGAGLVCVTITSFVWLTASIPTFHYCPFQTYRKWQCNCCSCCRLVAWVGFCSSLVLFFSHTGRDMVLWVKY